MTVKLEEVVRRHCRNTLRKVNGDVSLAAALLGIGRATLYRMLPGLEVETKGSREEKTKAARKEVIAKEKAMTKAQQDATRKLTAAEQDYLWAYKWNMVEGAWIHPRVNFCPMKRADAVSWTKNHPEIGW